MFAIADQKYFDEAICSQYNLKPKNISIQRVDNEES
jgi:hypothetical protein